MRTLMMNAAVAIVIAAPSVVAAQQSEPAAECLAEVRNLNDELVEAGYGAVGPRGYGVRPPPGYTGMLATPAGQIRTAIRAAHIFGINGDSETCEAIVSGIREMRKTYREAAVDTDISSEEVASWRTQWLEAAIPVEKTRESFQIEEVIGSAVRNTKDEYLGNIEDVLVRADGGTIIYALISRGGFLGIGEELVPVPWKELSVTPSPYRDTYVLDVSENVIEEAPRLKAGEPEEIAPADVRNKVDSYWSKHLQG